MAGLASGGPPRARMTRTDGLPEEAGARNVLINPQPFGMAISANPAAPRKGPQTLAQALLFHQGDRHRPPAVGEQVRSALDSPAGRAGV